MDYFVFQTSIQIKNSLFFNLGNNIKNKYLKLINLKTKPNTKVGNMFIKPSQY